MLRPKLLAVAVFCLQSSVLMSPAAQATALSDLLAAMAPGTWADVPNSHLPAYNGPLANAIHGNSGPSALMDAWNGAALDTTGNRLIVFGGGHQDYYGNEVYAFNLGSLTWTELSQPSDPSGTCSSANNGCTGPTLPDGQPTAVHTYDTPNYLPALNAVFSMAGATNISYKDYWLFDLNQNKWTRDIVAPGYAGADFANVSAYDSITKHVFVMPQGPIGGQVSNGLSEYDPGSNTWSHHGSNDVPDYHMTAEIDPVHRIFVAVGGGFFRVFDLTTGNQLQSSSSGDQTIVNGNAPGFTWDSSIGKFVGWKGGSTVYTLDPANWSWTAVSVASGSATPTPDNPQGTFSRFQYVAASNVFVGVNSVNEDVYIYKPNFGSVVPPPPPPPSSCDVNNDGRVDVADVQLEVNMALGVSPCTNPSGTCTVVSVQRVVNAVLGRLCTPP